MRPEPTWPTGESDPDRFWPGNVHEGALQGLSAQAEIFSATHAETIPRACNFPRLLLSAAGFSLQRYGVRVGGAGLMKGGGALLPAMHCHAGRRGRAELRELPALQLQCEEPRNGRF